MTRPNILFLMTDHTTARVLSQESPCLTPNLDALAAGGMLFRRCYTTNAICSPARASLMTGLYPSAHGMWDCTHTQRREWVDVPAGRFTYFSSVLADSGYHLGYFGKWHVEQSNRLEDFGWHEYDLTSQTSGERIPGSEVVVAKPGYRDYLLAAVREDGGDPVHPAYANGAGFIERHVASKDERPFCCFISTAEPHDPYLPPRRFMDMYDLDSLPLSPTLRDELSGKPEVVRRMQSVWRDLSTEQWRRVSCAYYALITYLDDQVGRVVDLLRERGLYETTLIVFTSDHGDMMGGHGLVTKGVGTSYEEVYNIPLILHGPGVPVGREEDEVCTSLVDLAPTLLDLCGTEMPGPIHGRSLRPILAGEPAGEEWQNAYAEFFGQRFVYTQRIIWHGTWKYVFSPGGIDELYDLSADPGELTNLADRPDHESVVRMMLGQMWQQMRDIGDDSLFNTQYATLRTAAFGPGILDEG